MNEPRRPDDEPEPPADDLSAAELSARSHPAGCRCGPCSYARLGVFPRRVALQLQREGY